MIYDMEDKCVLKQKNGAKIHNSASTIKILIMLSVLKKLSETNSCTNEIISINKMNRHLLKRDSIIFYEKDKNYEITINELICWMIKISENTCTDLLIDFVGFDYINDYAKSIGLKNTKLGRYMTDRYTSIENFDYKKENYSTLEDMCLVFNMMFKNKILDKQSCAYAITVLFDQRLNNKFPRFIADDIKFAHKTGGLSIGVNVCNDVGVLVIDEKKYFVGVFIENQDYSDNNLIHMGNCGKEIYNYLCNNVIGHQ